MLVALLFGDAVMSRLTSARCPAPTTKANAQWHAANAEEAIAGHPFDWALGCEGFDPRQKLGQCQPYLHSREACTKTHVRAEPKGYVAVGRAGNIETERI